MPATCSALVDQIRYEADWSGATDAQIVDVINRVQLRLQRENDFSWLEISSSKTLTTAASSAYLSYAQASDTKAIVTIYYVETNKRTIIPYLDFFQALDVHPDSTKLGKPEHWSEWQDTVYIFPTSNSALSLESWYYRILPDLTLTATNSFVSAGYDALFFGSMSQYHMIMGEDQKAQVWGQMQLDAVKSILTYHTRARERRRSSTIPNTPGRTG